MSNFNVGDVVVDLTNMDKWRDPKEFKPELFIYEFNNKVFMTNDSAFIITSNYERGNKPLSMSDNDLFSQSTGLNANKSRVLFNLTPHMTGLGSMLRKQKTPEELVRLKSSITMESDEDMTQFIIALKDAFLAYFDSIHEEIKPQVA